MLKRTIHTVLCLLYMLLYNLVLKSWANLNMHAGIEMYNVAIVNTVTLPLLK